MKKVFLYILLLISVQLAKSQNTNENDTSKQNRLNEVVISGSKFAEKQKNIVQKIDIITKKQMMQMNAQNSADVLINTGNVFVQKSQQGGGSPVIRGFEASRIQLNIDGIRFNNAITRSGHLQNIISVDNNALERMEVLNGPASTLHGSDALGGVILMKTIDAKFGDGKRFKLTGAQAMARYSSVNQEIAINAGIHAGNEKLASFTNVTYSSFDDLVQGKNGVDSIMNLWKKKFIVERINNTDTMLANPNPHKQVATGYRQMDVLQKIRFRQNKYLMHKLNLQLSNSSDIPRYDRLSEMSNGNPRHAEWYYGPQLRTLAAYTVDVNNEHHFFQDMNATISHQYWNESRHNRGYKKEFLADREEKVHVVGYNVALRRKQNIHEITMGSDGQFNSLTSVAHQTSVIDGTKQKVDTRYPDGNNNMNLIGFFAQHIMKLNHDKVVINDGLRFNYTSLRSTLKDTGIQFKLPITELKQQNNALTGNLGIAYMPNDEIRFTANISTGFRSPNIDDMAKVFESNNSMLLVPNKELKPEYTQSAEIGIGYRTEKLDLQLFGFYTHFTNAIVTDVFTYNGQDSILYNGSMTKVFASQNKAKAFLYGGGFNLTYELSTHFKFYGSANYTFGRFNQGDSALTPLDHIPPVNGRLALKYATNQWYAELYSLFNGAKKLFDYNVNGEDNLLYATPLGTPSWYTINLRAGYTIAKQVQLQVGLENILDRNYRYFASGMSAPGRNLVMAVRYQY